MDSWVEKGYNLPGYFESEKLDPDPHTSKELDPDSNPESKFRRFWNPRGPWVVHVHQVPYQLKNEWKKIMSTKMLPMIITFHKGKFHFFLFESADGQLARSVKMLSTYNEGCYQENVANS